MKALSELEPYIKQGWSFIYVPIPNNFAAILWRKSQSSIRIDAKTLEELLGKIDASQIG